MFFIEKHLARRDADQLWKTIPSFFQSKTDKEKWAEKCEEGLLCKVSFDIIKRIELCIFCKIAPDCISGPCRSGHGAGVPFLFAGRLLQQEVISNGI